MKKRSFFAALLIIVAGFLSAEGTVETNADKNEDGPVNVTVSILPQKGLVESIGGDRVEVQVLVQPGQSPHTYEPTPKQVMQTGEADALFTFGFPFEQIVVTKLSSGNEAIEVFAADKGVKRREIEEHHHGEEETENEHHGEPDPHIWLGPPQLQTIAQNICSGLIKIDPANRDRYTANLESFLTELQEVDKEIGSILKPYRGRKILVFHPAFGYFCDHYDIHQLPIEIEGKSPGPKQMENVIEEAREEQIKIIFVQPQFDKKSADLIAEAIGGAVVPLDPLHEDVMENLEIIAENIKGNLQSCPLNSLRPDCVYTEGQLQEVSIIVFPYANPKRHRYILPYYAGGLHTLA